MIYLQIQYPKIFSSEIKDLVRGVLQADLTKRLGNMKNGVAVIKTHRWFQSTDWVAVHQKKVCLTHLRFECRLRYRRRQ